MKAVEDFQRCDPRTFFFAAFIVPSISPQRAAENTELRGSA